MCRSCRLRRAATIVTATSVSYRDDAVQPLERLEPRRLFASLVVDGTGGNDLFEMRAGAGLVVVSVNGFPVTGVDALTDSVTINAMGGDDTVLIFATGTRAGVVVSINAGEGNDFIQITPTDGGAPNRLSNAPQHLSIDGGGGTESIGFFDTGEAQSVTYTLTDTNLSTSLTGFGGADYANVEGLSIFATHGDAHVVATPTIAGRNLFLSLQDGNNDVEVLAAAGPVTVLGGDGNDLVQLGSSAGIGLGGVTGAFFFNEAFGAGGSDTLVLHDEPNALNHAYTVTGAGVARTGTASLPSARFERVRLFGGSGANALLVNAVAPNVTYDLSAGAGDDSITVGGGNVDANLPSSATINIDGQGGFDLVAVADTASPNPNDYVVDSAQSYKRQQGGGPRTSALVNYVGHERLNADCGVAGAFVLCNATRAGVDTNFSLGAGDDVVWLANGPGDLEALAGPLTIKGGTDTDHVVLFDAFSGDSDDTAVTSATIQHPNMGTINWASGVENIYIDGPAGANGYFIDSSAPGTQVSVKGGGGDDFMWTANTTGNLANTGRAIFDGQGGLNSLILIDNGVSLGSNYAITDTHVARTGWAGCDYANVVDLTLYGQGDDNAFNVDGTAAGVKYLLRGGGGNDALFEGNTVTHNLDVIRGEVEWDGGDGTADRLVLRDSGNARNDPYTIRAAEFSRPLAARTTYANVEQFQLEGATGFNNIAVESSAAGCAYQIYASDGGDNISLGTGNLSDVAGAVAFHGTDDFNEVFLMDQAAPGGPNYGINPASVTRTGMGTFTFDGCEDLTLNCAPGGTVIFVNGTAPTTQVNVIGGPGNDQLLLSNGGTTGLSAIPARVTFHGEDGADRAELHDEQVSTLVHYTIDAMLVSRTSGFGGFAFDGTEQVLLKPSNGGNINIDVNGSSAGTSINVDVDAGNKNFRFAPTAHLMSAIAGPVVIDGGPDPFSAATFDDSARATGEMYWLDANQFWTDSSARVTFTSVRNLRAIGGQAADTFRVIGTPPASASNIEARGGADLLNVMETGVNAYVGIPLDPTNSPDALIVNQGGSGRAWVATGVSQTFSSIQIESGGLLSIESPFNRTLRTSTLNIAGTGAIDLNYSSMIVDYTGPSPLAAVQSLLASGYAVGTWTGSGIRSAAAATTPNRGVGLALATDLFTSFPNAFGGQLIDGTCVLLRYTAYGDADLSGNVNLTDFNRLATNFGQTNRRWSQGDFNYDGNANLIDFNRLAANFGTSVAPIALGEAQRGRGVEDLLDLI